MWIGLLLSSLIAHCLPAWAEYRAYELLIVNKETKAERRITSTLDHIQYPAYYPLNAKEQVYYADSWRCTGRTGEFRTICTNPKPKSDPVSP